MKKVYILSVNTYPELLKEEVERIINRNGGELEAELFDTNEVGIFINKK